MVRPVCLENKVLPGWRGKLAAFAESQKTTNFIAAIIILNAITLGLETSDQVMASYGAFLHLTDQIFIGIFVVEMLVKILAYRLSFSGQAGMCSTLSLWPCHSCRQIPAGRSCVPCGFSVCCA